MVPARLWLPQMNMKRRCSSVAKWHHEVESSRHRLCFFSLFPVAEPGYVRSPSVLSVHLYVRQKKIIKVLFFYQKKKKKRLLF